MKKRVSLLVPVVLVLSLCACSPGAAVSTATPEPSPLETEAVVPEYSLINSDEYTQGGKAGIGYRVEIGDEASEEDMMAVFADLCSGDAYALHTVWFYGLASDVEDVGHFTVGMIEEGGQGADPTFTPCTYGAELIASMRERAAEEAALAALNRSIPAEVWTWKHDSLLHNNIFSPVDELVFVQPKKNEVLVGRGSLFFVDGDVSAFVDSFGKTYIQFSTDYGDLYLASSAGWFDFGDISQGDTATIYFSYSEWSVLLDGPVGEYVYHE